MAYELIYDAARMLSQVCDGAVHKDESGFSGADQWVKTLLSAEVTPKRAMAIGRALIKYRGQLLGFGVNYSALVTSVRELEATVKASDDGARPGAEARVDGRVLAIYSPYNEGLVATFRQLRSARWNSERKAWTFDLHDAGKAIEALLQRYPDAEVPADLPDPEETPFGRIDVVEDNPNNVAVLSGYNEELVAAIKDFRNRQWDGGRWLIAFASRGTVNKLEELAKRFKLEITINAREVIAGKLAANCR